MPAGRGVAVSVDVGVYVSHTSTLLYVFRKICCPTIAYVKPGCDATGMLCVNVVGPRAKFRFCAPPKSCAPLV